MWIRKRHRKKDKVFSIYEGEREEWSKREKFIAYPIMSTAIGSIIYLTYMSNKYESYDPPQVLLITWTISIFATFAFILSSKKLLKEATDEVGNKILEGSPYFNLSQLSGLFPIGGIIISVLLYKKQIVNDELSLPFFGFSLLLLGCWVVSFQFLQSFYHRVENKYFKGCPYLPCRSKSKALIEENKIEASFTGAYIALYHYRCNCCHKRWTQTGYLLYKPKLKLFKFHK